MKPVADWSSSAPRLFFRGTIQVDRSFRFQPQDSTSISIISDIFPCEMEDSTEYMSLRADLPLLCSSPTDTLTHTNRTTFTHSSSAPHALSLEHRQSAFRSNAKAGFVISKIEEVLESMIDCFLKDGKELVIELKSNRKGGSATSSNAETKQRKTSGITSVRFPGKSEHEVWKFSKLFLYVFFLWFKLIWLQRFCCVFSSSLMKHWHQDPCPRKETFSTKILSSSRSKSL